MQNRHLDSQLQAHFQKYRQILMLLGPRQTGKTTILKRLFPQAQYLLVEKEPVRNVLETFDTESYKNIFRPEGMVVLDEVQLLSNPGRAAKLIFDVMPRVNLVITGSSSLYIKNKTGESMAGRRIEYRLFPLTFSEFLSQKEIETAMNFRIFENVISAAPLKKRVYAFDKKTILKNVMIYGLYPSMLNLPQDRKYLLNLTDSIIFKDILSLSLINNKQEALNLLKLLAYQIGNLINYTELSSKLQMDVRRVRRYIEIFEDSFLIFRLFPFSKSGRNEIGKSPKIYFYDTGLRNALIENFSKFDLRADSGALFENFIITEVLKANSYLDAGFKLHFWRTKQGSEVDLVLTRGEEIIGAEIKLGRGNPTPAFAARYPQAVVKKVDWENFY